MTRIICNPKNKRLRKIYGKYVMASKSFLGPFKVARFDGIDEDHHFPFLVSWRDKFEAAHETGDTSFIKLFDVDK